MRKKWIIIRIETKAREFESKMLLAYKLINEGYGVIIKNELGGQVKRFPKGIYMINSIYSNAVVRVNDIVENGNQIIVLDEEGLVMLDKENYLKRLDESCMKHISKFLCYGHNQHKIVSDKFSEYQDKLQITGNPRINLLNSMFNSIDFKYVEDIRYEYGDFILIVSNFSFVNMNGSKSKGIHDRKERVYNQLSKMNLINNDTFLDQFEYIDALFSSFMDLVKDLATQYPRLNIIIRPHPSEDHRLWDEIALEFKNVKVIYEGNLTQWIRASKLVIQNGCTSAIESLFLNKACITYHPISNPKYDQPLPKLLSVGIEDIRGVFNVIDEIENENEDIILNKYSYLKTLAEPYVSFTKLDESINEIFNIINDLEIKTQHYSSKIYFFRAFIPVVLLENTINALKKIVFINADNIIKMLEKTNIKRFKQISSRIKLYVKEKKYEEKKNGKYYKSEIDELFNKFNAIYNMDSEFYIKEIDKNTFIIK